MSAKYAFIRGEEGNYSVRSMCTWSGVSRGGYYEWKDRAPSCTALWRAELGEIIEYLFDDSDATYGYRRIHAALARVGRFCDEQTVRSIMAERGLVSCQPRPRGPVTTIASDAGDTPDLLNRDFTADEPGTKLVGDITYLATWAGWVYLATVLDCFSKKVVGYALAAHMRTDLVTDALAMAVRNGHIRPGTTIFHSDRGTQGEIKWSSQHLHGGGAAWCQQSRARGVVDSRTRIGRSGLGCGPRVGHRRRGQRSARSGL